MPNYSDNLALIAAIKAKPATAKAKQPSKKAIVTALKKFMAVRDEKIEKQLHETDHLALFEKARQLALRLADPQQVAVYIGELNQEAVSQAHKHHEKFRECRTFWYGPDGLKWLAFKKGMNPEEWLDYKEFMDAPALKALTALSSQVPQEENAPICVSDAETHEVGMSRKLSPAEIFAALKSKQLASGEALSSWFHMA